MSIFCGCGRWLSSCTVSSPLEDVERRLVDSVGWLGDEPAALQQSLPKLWRSRCATTADPAVSCESGWRNVSRQTGAGPMEWDVAAATGEGVNIACDVALAAPEKKRPSE